MYARRDMTPMSREKRDLSLPSIFTQNDTGKLNNVGIPWRSEKKRKRSQPQVGSFPTRSATTLTFQ